VRVIIFWWGRGQVINAINPSQQNSRRWDGHQNLYLQHSYKLCVKRGLRFNYFHTCALWVELLSFYFNHMMLEDDNYFDWKSYRYLYCNFETNIEYLIHSLYKMMITILHEIKIKFTAIMTNPLAWCSFINSCGCD